MNHFSKRSHGKKGTTWSRAGSVADAAKLAGRDRSTIHRWISRGLLWKCDKNGLYSNQGRYVWLVDVVDFLADFGPKSGKALTVDSKRPAWKLRLDDPECRFQRARVDSSIRRLARDMAIAKKPISSSQALDYLKLLQPVIAELTKIAGRKT